MATTTPNFGWAVPTSTDLVKDGAVAIETLGDSIDASLVDLKGGTTGQVLTKASGTDMDFSWTAVDPLVILDAKGDLITATAADTPARLAVGTNNQVLTADSSTATGLKWATPAAGGSSFEFISRTTFSDVASQAFDGVFTSTYQKYYVAFDNFIAATSTDDLQLQFRYAGPTTQTTTYYGSINISAFNANIATTLQSNTSQYTIAPSTGLSTSGSQGSGYLYFSNVGNSSQRASVISNYIYPPDAQTTMGGGNNDTARTYTGFLLKSSSTNISGTVTIYGLKNS